MPAITITISIDVPAGSNVRVAQGQHAASRTTSGTAAKPFVARPDPEYPQWDPTCPQHGVEWNLVPAGQSRTKVDENGDPKRYNAFWTCPERGCNEKPERKPANDSVDEDGLDF